MDGIILGLIGVMFVAIIGVYIIAIKILRDVNTQLSKSYDTINSHIQDKKSHPIDATRLITHSECEDRQATIEAKLEAFADKMECFANDMSEVKTDIKTIIRKLPGN